MQFQRLDENKIKCIVTHEEMEARGLTSPEVLTDQDKVRGFVTEVVEKAHRELGMEPTSAAYTVQMTMAEDGDLTMIISPDMTFDIKHFLEALKQSAIAAAKAQEYKASHSLPVKADGTTEGKMQVVDYTKTPLWVVLDTLPEALSLIHRLPVHDGMTGDLFKFDGHYYLRIRFNVSTHEISSTILVLAEYSEAMYTETYDGAYIVEHGDLLCEDALKKLREI